MQDALYGIVFVVGVLALVVGGAYLADRRKARVADRPTGDKVMRGIAAVLIIAVVLIAARFVLPFL